VKRSLRGWLVPTVRMAIGSAVGVGLLVLCELKAARKYLITAHALDAAGIAIIYATFFAADLLWHLIGTITAFVLLVLVTGLAVLLSTRRGSLFIALLGLMGGFAIPALLSTGEDHPITLLFALYLPLEQSCCRSTSSLPPGLRSHEIMRAPTVGSGMSRSFILPANVCTMWRRMSRPSAIAYYVTAHGYGHGVRSCDILRAVNQMRPGLPIVIVSDLPAAFFQARLNLGSFVHRPGSFDVGMVQPDSIRVDVPATLLKVEALYARREELIEREVSFLAGEGVGLVVADIPAIPLQAAAKSGIPRITVGNFAWDWIYSAYQAQDQRWAAVSRAFAEDYGKADLLLRLPFHEQMSAFPCVEDIPLVASPGRARRAEMAEITGARQDRPWVLLSFTTLEWDDRALESVGRIDGYEFFTVRPLYWERRNIHPIDREVIPFSDIVASVDAVLSKPGFGILSECIANRKPLIYAERSGFLEYPILESAIKRYLRHVHIPTERLYRGDLREALDAVWDLPEPPEAIPLGGDVIAAERILSFL